MNLQEVHVLRQADTKTTVDNPTIIETNVGDVLLTKMSENAKLYRATWKAFSFTGTTAASAFVNLTQFIKRSQI